MSNEFTALVIDQADDKIVSEIKSVDAGDLPVFEDDTPAVTVSVAYSGVNYKDGLVMGGLGGLVKTYPHIPGIDLAGTVEASDDLRYSVGDPVVSTGWTVGERVWGGYAQKARVKAGWLVPLPDGMTLRQAMGVGTAGLTAMLATQALEDHGITPEAGEILVTGAAGGVGSVATAILAHCGYQVVASTGRAELAGYLRGLGAASVIDRAELSEAKPKPLDAQRWAGCVDSVAGPTLATVLAHLKKNGAIAACGLAGGAPFSTTVIPFLLRGVSLLGMNSLDTPFETRLAAWDRIARDLPSDKLDAIITEVGLSDLAGLGPDILAGKVRGRTVVDVNR